MQLDQVHRQYEIEVTRINNENQKLQNDLTQIRINFDKLEEEYKKEKNTNKNIDRISKEKIIEYENMFFFQSYLLFFMFERSIQS